MAFPSIQSELEAWNKEFPADRAKGDQNESAFVPGESNTIQQQSVKWLNLLVDLNANPSRNRCHKTLDSNVRPCSPGWPYDVIAKICRWPVPVSGARGVELIERNMGFPWYQSQYKRRKNCQTFSRNFWSFFSLPYGPLLMFDLWSIDSAWLCLILAPECLQIDLQFAFWKNHQYVYIS